MPIWVLLVMGILSIATFRVPFTYYGHYRPYLLAYPDDFYYYLKIAENLANGRGSTFDSVTLTNGYHPLWLGLMACLCKVVPPTGMGFFVILQSIILVSTVVSAVLFWRLLGRLYPIGQNAAVAALLLFHMVNVAYANEAMEVVLAIPFLLMALLKLDSLLDRPSMRSGLQFGLWSASAVMARLDVVLLLLTLLGVLMVKRRDLLRPHVHALGISALVVLIVGVAYAVINFAVFRIPVPTSGVAKQLNAKGFISWESISWAFTQGFHAQQVFGFPLAASLLFGSIAVGRIGQVERSLASKVITIALAAWTPFFFIFHLTSTQYPIYSWYFYPVAISLPMMMILGFPKIVHNRMPWLAVAVVASILMVRDVVTIRPSSADAVPRFQMAMQLRQWAHDHPGRYAMGDRAGLTGYLLPMPLIQLEGLVADRDMLDFIRSQAHILDVFAHYSVDYYVRTRSRPTPPDSDGCYDAHEPINVHGSRTKRLTGVICEKPAFRFVASNGMETAVFKVGAN